MPHLPALARKDPQIGLILAFYMEAWSPGEEQVTEEGTVQGPHTDTLSLPAAPPPPAFWPGYPSVTCPESRNAPNYLEA